MAPITVNPVPQLCDDVNALLNSALVPQLHDDHSAPRLPLLHYMALPMRRVRVLAARCR